MYCTFLLSVFFYGISELLCSCRVLFCWTRVWCLSGIRCIFVFLLVYLFIYCLTINTFWQKVCRHQIMILFSWADLSMFQRTQWWHIRVILPSLCNPWMRCGSMARWGHGVICVAKLNSNINATRDLSTYEWPKTTWCYTCFAANWCHCF